MIYIVSNQIKLFDSDIKQATLEDCLNFCEKLDILGVDTETEGFDPYTKKVLSLQIGNKEHQYVIDTNDIPLIKFKSLFESTSKIFIFQNAQFDLRFLYHAGINPINIYDTLLAECIITGGYGNKDDIKHVKGVLNQEIAEELVDRKLGLDALVMKYCNVVLDKSIQGEIHRERLSTRVIKYGAKDVEYLINIREKQLEILKEMQINYGIDGKVLELENSVVKVFSKMAYNGVKIDKNKYKTLVVNVAKEEVEAAITSLDKEVHKEPKLSKFRLHQGNLFFQDRITEINWNSSTQKLQILKILQPDIKDTSSNTIRKELKHPIKNALLDYNLYRKLEAAFGEEFLKQANKVTGRMHPSIWQILATGRISMRDPNLLQIPSKGKLGSTIRSCFIPEKGYKIVGGDYSGFELRIIAEYSQDPLWVNAFKNGEDLHSLLCSQTFDIPISDVKKPFPYNTNMTYRDVQKTLNFGLSYGMSEFKLSNTIGVPVDQAEEVIKKFFSKVPAVEKFLNGLGQRASLRGYIKVPNPYGRVRFFPKYNVIKQYPNETCNVAKKWHGEMERAGKNSPIQGVNGTVIKIALIKVQEEIDKHNYPVKILLSVYDELQTECREDFAEEWCKILEQKMVEAGEVLIKTVPIIAECKITDYWSK